MICPKEHSVNAIKGQAIINLGRDVYPNSTGEISMYIDVYYCPECNLVYDKKEWKDEPFLGLDGVKITELPTSENQTQEATMEKGWVALEEQERKNCIFVDMTEEQMRVFEEHIYPLKPVLIYPGRKE
jgi:NMD protein affecting ribosome stability and mRNA decay